MHHVPTVLALTCMLWLLLAIHIVSIAIAQIRKHANAWGNGVWISTCLILCSAIPIASFFFVAPAFAEPQAFAAIFIALIGMLFFHHQCQYPLGGFWWTAIDEEVERSAADEQLLQIVERYSNELRIQTPKVRRWPTDWPIPCWSNCLITPMLLISPALTIRYSAERQAAFVAQMLSSISLQAALVELMAWPVAFGIAVAFVAHNGILIGTVWAIGLGVLLQRIIIREITFVINRRMCRLAGRDHSEVVLRKQYGNAGKRQAGWRAWLGYSLNCATPLCECLAKLPADSVRRHFVEPTPLNRSLAHHRIRFFLGALVWCVWLSIPVLFGSMSDSLIATVHWIAIPVLVLKLVDWLADSDYQRRVQRDFRHWSLPKSAQCCAAIGLLVFFSLLFFAVTRFHVVPQFLIGSLPLLSLGMLTISLFIIFKEYFLLRGIESDLTQYYYAGHWAKLLALAEHYSREVAKSPSITFYAAVAQAQLNVPSAALETLRLAQIRFPKCAPMLSVQAQLHLREGHFEELRQVGEKLVQQFPDDPNHWIIDVHIARFQSDFDRAKASLATAARLGAHPIDIALAEVEISLAQNQVARAEELLKDLALDGDGDARYALWKIWSAILRKDMTKIKTFVTQLEYDMQSPDYWSFMPDWKRLQQLLIEIADVAISDSAPQNKIEQPVRR